MKKELSIFAVSALCLIPSSVWGYSKISKQYDEWKAETAAETINQKLLSQKIQTDKNGKTVLASTITIAECQQALYLAYLNDIEYQSRIKQYDNKISMIKSAVTAE